ncbi:MAG: hypothetical protein JSW71_15135 [Gemmatimonadota bacterium]|nr:MAG: hypothetical protein JSW71_15135 [Gemmatimonadota bacterium]
MKNVTITLDEEVARWARIRAAELDTSVSRMLGDMLRDRMERDQAYQLASKQYLSRKPKVLNESRKPYPARDQLHERPRIR